MKIVKRILLKIVIFTAVKNRCILHGRVFVMNCSIRILFSVSTTLGINISLNCILLAFAYGSTRYFVRTSVPKFCVSLPFQNLFTN